MLRPHAFAGSFRVNLVLVHRVLERLERFLPSGDIKDAKRVFIIAGESARDRIPFQFGHSGIWRSRQAFTELGPQGCADIGIRHARQELADLSQDTVSAFVQIARLQGNVDIIAKQQDIA